MHWETMPITDFVLDGGMHLLIEPIAATKTAAIGFWFSCGSRDEADSESGVTHFVEHMLFKGTASRSAWDIARFFDGVGGFANAFTERECMCAYCVVPSYAAADSFEVLADMACNSSFPLRELEKERDVIISEILSTLDDPEEMAMDEALRLAFGDHSITRPIAGKVDGIKGISLPSVREYYEKNILPRLSVISVAGNIDGEAIKELARRYARKGGIVPNMGPAPIFKPGRQLVRSEFSQSQIALSYPLPFFSTAPEWHLWDAINVMTGDSVSSRLFQRLREERGLCYSVYSFVTRFRDCAFITAFLSVPDAKILEATISLIDEFRAIGANGFSAEEFDRAKSHILGEMIISSEDIENRMRRLARQFFFNGKMIDIDSAPDLVNSLSAERINIAAREALGRDSMTLMIYSGKRVKKDVLCH